MRERYGWVNRSMPDSELDAFVDAFAHRVGRSEKRALQLSKKMVNARAGVPSEGDLWTSNHVLAAVNTWPEGAAMLTKLNAAGFGQPREFELNLVTESAISPLPDRPGDRGPAVAGRERETAGG